MADTSGEKERSWLNVLWPIVAGIGWTLFAASWYAGGLTTTVATNSGLIRQLQVTTDELHRTDIENKIDIAKARDERNHAIEDLERRLTDKSDAVNEKISSATATNQATRDMLMMIERRLEAVEHDARVCK